MSVSQFAKELKEAADNGIGYKLENCEITFNAINDSKYLDIKYPSNIKIIVKDLMFYDTTEIIIANCKFGEPSNFIFRNCDFGKLKISDVRSKTFMIDSSRIDKIFVNAAK